MQSMFKVIRKEGKKKKSCLEEGMVYRYELEIIQLGKYTHGCQLVSILVCQGHKQSVFKVIRRGKKNLV